MCEVTATSHYPTPRCRRGRGIFVKRGGGVRPSRETPIYRRPVYIAIPVRPPAPPAAKAGHRCGISDHASRPSPPPTSLLFPTSGSLSSTVNARIPFFFSPLCLPALLYCWNFFRQRRSVLILESPPRSVFLALFRCFLYMPDIFSVANVNKRSCALGAASALPPTWCNV